MISQKAKYALRAMIALTHAEERGEVMSIAEIATAERIPKKFLEQILLDLKRNGLVESRRGKAGGYAVQGLAGTFVVKLVGSYTNVVGLPLYETVSLLSGEGYNVHFSWLSGLTTT